LQINLARRFATLAAFTMLQSPAHGPTRFWEARVNISVAQNVKYSAAAEARSWKVLLQKSKIERPPESRECGFLAVFSTAARLCRTDTAICSRF
jgi:hypothetical protein